MSIGITLSIDLVIDNLNRLHHSLTGSHDINEITQRRRAEHQMARLNSLTEMGIEKVTLSGQDLDDMLDGFFAKQPTTKRGT